MKHGGSYHGGGKKNNSGGAAQPKTGDQYTPLCRASGFDKTMAAMGSSRGSQYPASGKHNQWEGAGEGTGGNTVGWHPE